MFGKLLKKKRGEEEPVNDAFDFREDTETAGDPGVDISPLVLETPSQSGRPEQSHHTPIVNIVNMVPFEWARPVIAESMGKKVDREVFGKTILFLFLVFLVGLAMGGALYYKSVQGNSLSARLGAAGGELSEFETVAENLALYKSYAEIPNSPPVYVQFYGVSFLAVRNGLLAGKISYSQALSGEVGSRVNRDGFAIETGKRLEDIDMSGVWTITGTVSPRAGGGADSNWAMNFARQATTLFERAGLKAYARVTPASGGRTSGSPDVVATILLWK